MYGCIMQFNVVVLRLDDGGECRRVRLAIFARDLPPRGDLKATISALVAISALGAIVMDKKRKNSCDLGISSAGFNGVGVQWRWHARDMLT
jgi:hypothetical protein